MLDIYANSSRVGRPRKRKASELDLSETPHQGPFPPASCASSKVSDWLESLPARRSLEANMPLPSNKFSAPPSMSCQSEASVSKTNKRTADPIYRDDCLRNHRIYIDPLGLDQPAQITTFIRDVVDKDRDSDDDMDYDEVRKAIGQLEDEAEDTFKEGILDTSLFPQKRNHEGIAISTSIPYTSAPLPHTHGYDYKPLVTPTPDRAYGFLAKLFEDKHNYVQNTNKLRDRSRVTTASCWPFFSIEFKAQSRGGTIWVAENQNAGTGSHSVSSVETLWRYAREQKSQVRELVDSVAFSCSIDAKTATLHIHWLTDDSKYMMSEVRGYWMKKPDDLKAFRRHAKNIIDYGLGTRLPKIKAALEDLLPIVETWQAEDRSKGKRGSQTATTVSENESFNILVANSHSSSPTSAQSTAVVAVVQASVIKRPRTHV